MTHIDLSSTYTEACSYSAFDSELPEEQCGECIPDLPGYLALVKRIARHIHHRLPPEVQLGDLVSAGNMGLTLALNSFDPSHGVSFTAYAGHRIRGAILDQLRQLDPGTRGLRTRQRQLVKAQSTLTDRLGREPESVELAGEMGTSLDNLFALKSELRAVEVERRPATGGSDLPSFDVLEEIPASGDDDPLALFLKVEQRSSLVEAIDKLPEKLRLVLALKYHEELSNREISSILDLSESRVSQMHSQAIKLLRQRLKS